MPAIKPIWFCNRFWRIAQLDLAQISLFMPTMHDFILLEILSNFARKIAWEWHHIHRTHRI
jgi:hypothetical protein